MRDWQIIVSGAKLILRPRANEQVSIHAPRPCHDYYLQFGGVWDGQSPVAVGLARSVSADSQHNFRNVGNRFGDFCVCKFIVST